MTDERSILSGMNRLELLGLTAAMTDWLDISSGASRMLVAMMLGGRRREWTKDALAEVCAPVSRRRQGELQAGTNLPKVYICRLRAALMDVGVGDPFEVCRGAGYRRKPGASDQIAAGLLGWLV